ncbi:MAG: nucleotidyltransferase domain-containing protein [Methylococcales bacterium]
MDIHKLLRKQLHDESAIEFAVLIGSRANGTAQPDSDWDIALQWNMQLDWLELLGKTETLRRNIAEAMGIESNKIDLIELRRSNLAMRASVAENGISLTGEETLAWAYFLTRTWRELEDFYWDQSHAA